MVSREQYRYKSQRGNGKAANANNRFNINKQTQRCIDGKTYGFTLIQTLPYKDFEYVYVPQELFGVQVVTQMVVS